MTLFQMVGLEVKNYINPNWSHGNIGNEPTTYRITAPHAKAINSAILYNVNLIPFVVAQPLMSLIITPILFWRGNTESNR